MSKIAAIIPARWDSTRFPGKPLVTILGKPLVQHVWERCAEADGVDSVIVATDDMRIAEAAFAFGAEVSLTRSSHVTGTDRIGEVAGRLRGYSHVINVQGDEPAIEPALIGALAAKLRSDAACQMVTAAAPFKKSADLSNPNQVKVLVGLDGNAIYFSRLPIPYVRNAKSAARPLQHLGIYGYRTAFLKKIITWAPTRLEMTESLEQLRALDHGVRIAVVETKAPSPGVDTPEDVAAAERALKAMSRRRRAARSEK